MLSDNSVMKATEVILQKDPEDGWTIGMRFLAYCIQKASLPYTVTIRVDDGGMSIINNETTGKLIGFDITISKDDDSSIRSENSVRNKVLLNKKYPPVPKMQNSLTARNRQFPNAVPCFCLPVLSPKKKVY